MYPHTISSRLFFVAVLALAPVALVTSAVEAQKKPAAQPADKPDAKTLAEARAHFAKGNELYQKGDKPGAVGELKIAYRLTHNALLLYNIGLIHDEMGDKTIAVYYYGKFLSDAPNDEATRENRKLATDRSTSLNVDIEKEEAAAAKTVEAEKTKEIHAVAEKVREFTHKVVDEVPPGVPFDVVALIPPEADWSLVLYYRQAGQAAFKATRMRDRFHENVARIPGEEVNGATLQYYIEVKDRSGTLVAASGRASSPNVVDIVKGADAHHYADLSEQGSTQMVKRGDLLEGDKTLPPIARGRSGPFFDMSQKRMRYAKWGTTIGAAALLSASLSFFLVAQSKATELEGVATSCGLPPCTPFGPAERDLQSSGKTFQTLSNWSLVLGILSAGAATTLWYFELRNAPPGRTDAAALPTRIVAAPLVSDEFVGGAARIEF